MVDILLLDALGAADPATLLGVMTEYTRPQPNGRTQTFFSDRTIYDSTVLVQSGAGGAQTGYLGHVAIKPNGGLGFNPEAVLKGDVDGVSLLDFFRAEAAAGKSGTMAWQDMLAGDDAIRGNAFRHDLHGYAGDDLLMSGSAASFLYGDGGDDVIFTANAFGTFGGDGADTFVVTGFDNGYNLAADFVSGLDTIAIDMGAFAGVDGREDIHFGRVAQTPDDHLIVRNVKSGGAVLYYDADGSGEQAPVEIGRVYSETRLHQGDFSFVDAQSFLPKDWQASAADVATAHAGASGHGSVGVLAHPLDTQLV